MQTIQQGGSIIIASSNIYDIFLTTGLIVHRKRTIGSVKSRLDICLTLINSACQITEGFLILNNIIISQGYRIFLGIGRRRILQCQRNSSIRTCYCLLISIFIFYGITICPITIVSGMDLFIHNIHQVILTRISVICKSNFCRTATIHARHNIRIAGHLGYAHLVAHGSSCTVSRNAYYVFISRSSIHSTHVGLQLEVRHVILKCLHAVVNPYIGFLQPLLLHLILIHFVVLLLLVHHAHLNKGFDVKTGTRQTIYAVCAHFRRLLFNLSSFI